MKAFKSKAFSVVMVAILLIGLLGSGGVAAQTAGESYIVQSQSAAEAARLVEQYGGTVTSQLDVIGGVGALLSDNTLKALRSDARVRLVTANAATVSSEDKSTDDKKKTTEKEKSAVSKLPAADYPEVSGADLVWKEDITGEGVAVAVLDSGIDPKPFAGTDKNDKSSRIVGWADFIDKKSKTPNDPNGHGTHVAGIIGNSQVGSDGGYNGMAPEVKLVGVRVLDKTGQGTYEGIIQGIQWVITNKDKYHIRVINLSLQTNVQAPYWADPLNQAVTRAWAEGLVVITVAGNSGPSAMTISVPGNNPYAITVGAFTDNFTPTDWSDDYIAPFSAAGPTLDGFAKPDLIAPGAHMVSTMSKGSYVARNHDANWVSGDYFSMAGTSQAAAVTSGTAALMLSRLPDLTPDQVKYRLMVSAMPWVKADGSDVLYSIWQQGAGRLNTFDAVMSDAPEMNGSANAGMDIQADLTTDSHYEGYSYYDETTGMFRLRGTEDWTSGFGAWSGGFGAWSGGFGAWSGGFGAWSGGFGAWSGSLPWADTVYATPAFVSNFLGGVAPNSKNQSASITWAEEPLP